VTSKNKRDAADPIKADTEDASGPSHEEIRHRAYEIYLERDGLGGKELDDWLQAETEIGKDTLVSRTTKKQQA
jgi:hypothetical protein